MYYILIILGIALVIAGVIGLTKGADNKNIASEKVDDSSSNSEIWEKDVAVKENYTDDKIHDDGLSDSERKGQAFEMYVRDHFSHKDYSLVEHVNDKVSHEHVTERSKYPDMVFRHRSSNTKFAVECKYRSDWFIKDDILQIEWAEEHNIENYLHFADEQKMDVVVIIGIGGTADNPAEVYAAPLYALKKYTYVYKSYLEDFKLTNPNANYNFILSKHTVEN